MDVVAVLRSRFVRNSAARFIINIVVKLVSLLIVVAVARLLGPAQLGKYSFTLYLANLVAVVAALGIPFYLQKEIARLGEKERSLLLSGSLNILLFVSFLLLLSSLLVPHVLGYRPNVMIALVLASVWILASFVDSVFIGREEQAREIPPIFFREAVRLAASLSLIFLLSYYLAPLLGQALSMTIFLLLTAPYIYRYLSPVVVEVRKILSRSIFYLFTTVTALLLLYVDTILLYLLAGAEATGYYRVPGSIVGSVLQIFPFTVASFPALSRRVKDTDVTSALRLYAPAVFLGALGFQAVTILLGKPFIDIVFGPQYSLTYPLLVLLSFLIPIRALYYYMLQGVIVAGGEKIQAVFPGIGVFVNALLDFLLIPEWGPYGAAVASIVSFALSGFLAFLYLRRWKGWNASS